MFSQLHKILQDLPVAKEAVSIVQTVLRGSVTIVSAATGSGKTLFATSLLAERSDHQVVVLVPRRFLAVNAAETIAELAGVELGQEVGYAVGSQSGEQSCFSEATKLLFVTYGYAISSGLIKTVRTIVLDEIHEADMDMSICRALILRRITSGERVRVMEMSATIDAERQAGYWKKVVSAEVFEVEGSTIPCVVRHEKDSVENAVAGLIQKGRRGIVVFRPGVADVEDTADDIRHLLAQQGVQANVSMIYGEMGAPERRAATSAPAEGEIKVLVGTNVLESGINLMWLDGGVSCGTGKLPVARESGAVMLDLVDLSRWRLEQQKGRLTRHGNRADVEFGGAEFVLVSATGWNERDAETLPEIVRLPLTELVMHCARFGLRADQLTFDFPPEQEAVIRAEVKLQRLGLITKSCRLTDTGRFVAGLPLGPETGAMLWHAKQTGVLGAFLALAAVVEVDGVRKDFRNPHGKDGTSDYLDSLKAYTTVARDIRQAEERGQKLSKSEQTDLFEYHNVGYKRYQAVKQLLRVLRNRFNGEASSTMQASDQQLRRCLVAGFIDQLFRVDFSTADSLDGSGSYNLGHGSALWGLDSDFVIGRLRTIRPRNGNSPFTVLEKATKVDLEDIMAVGEIRSGLIKFGKRREQVDPITFRTVVAYTIFGELDLSSEIVDEPMSADELAQVARFEAMRDPLKARLEALKDDRTLVFGLPNIRCWPTHWVVGDWGEERPYEESGVAEMEGLMQRIHSVTADIQAISDTRKDSGMVGVEYFDEGFRLGYYGEMYPYSQEGIQSARIENNRQIADRQPRPSPIRREPRSLGVGLMPRATATPAAKEADADNPFADALRDLFKD